MRDVAELAAQLRRPRLLVQAARFGAGEYRRSRSLPRLLRSATLPRPATAIVQLLDLEGDLDERRRAADATYSVARHVEVLIALLGETAFLKAQRAAGREIAPS